MNNDIIKDIIDTVLDNTEISFIGSGYNIEKVYEIDEIAIEKEIIKILKER